MSKIDKLFTKIMEGSSDNNINFSDLCNLLISIGFDERIKGSHHIFTREDIVELNLQKNNNKAKEYQVRQIRNILSKYNIGDK